jgi:hypothetical protein
LIISSEIVPNIILNRFKGSTDRIKLAVDTIRESKRTKQRMDYETPAKPPTEVTKYQGRVGNGNMFGFVITFVTPENYHITITDGFHEGYKFESYTHFFNFLKQNQYDPEKERGFKYDKISFIKPKMQFYINIYICSCHQISVI